MRLIVVFALDNGAKKWYTALYLSNLVNYVVIRDNNIMRIMFQF